MVADALFALGSFSFNGGDKEVEGRGMKMKIIHKYDVHLAGDFFFGFARFEYAMKMAKYHKGNGAAEPDWARFAKELEPVFQNPDSNEFKKAVSYFTEHPPKKQVVEDGCLVWRKVEPRTNSLADKTLQLVRRVRNNLFHGGKFKGRLFEDPERSETLMRYGLVILDRCLSEMPEVCEAYEG